MLIAHELKDEIDKYRFRFADNSDSYESKTRTIAVTQAVSRASVFSGPRLSTLGRVVGVVARDVEFEVDEKLYHEILHYTHITLRKEVMLDDFMFLGMALMKQGFEAPYTGVLRSLWTNQEEFRTITGIFVGPSDKKLYYSKQSESRYLSEKEKSFRGSHSLDYCTKIPAYFVNMLVQTGIELHYLMGENREVNYTKQHDDLI